MKDEHYSRADLKTDTPMVEDSDDLKRAKDQLYKKLYFSGMAEESNRRLRNSGAFRLLRPRQAEYKLKYESRDLDNPYNSYDPERGAFPSNTRMHEHYW